MYISVIIPAYNESKKIKQTLIEVSAFLSQQKYTYEIIVTDDGSVDETKSVIQKYQKMNKSVVLISYGENKGKGYAIRSGFRKSKGDFILFIDADHSVNINYLTTFLPYHDLYDVTIGSIHLDASQAHDNNKIWREKIRNIGHKMPSLILNLNIEDTQRGFKLFSRKAVDIILPKQKINDFSFDIELLLIAKKNNLLIKEIPIIWNNSKSSHITVKTYILIFFGMLRIWFNNILGIYK